jgi:peptide/nickel transport system permease protein
MAMYQFVLRRLLLAVPTLLIVSFLIFGMIRLDPDSVVAARLGEGYTEEQANMVKETYGLNEPVATEYVKWLGRVVRGDWGESAYTFKPVLSEMAPKIGVTFELAFLAILFAVIIGVPIGVFSAMRQDRWPDYVLRSFAIFGLSVPGFLIATIVLALLAKNFGWIPSIRYQSLREDPIANLQQMWMPAFIVSLATSAQVMRYARTMMLDVLRQDYIRTAWGEGSARARDRGPARAEERTPARGHGDRAHDGDARRGHRDLRVALLAAGDGPPPDPGGKPEGLCGRPGSGVVFRHHGGAGEPHR